MAIRVHRLAVGFALVALLAGCGGEGGRQGLLRTIGLRQPPPDEFLVVERKPLEIPQDRSALPPPNPAGTNRVDPRPREDVVRTLGGTDAAITSSSPTLSPAEQAFIASAAPERLDPDVRTKLAEEDRALNSDAGKFGIARMFGVRTFDPYRDELLDPYEEARRLRLKGVRTPAAPEKEPEKPGSLF